MQVMKTLHVQLLWTLEQRFIGRWKHNWNMLWRGLDKMNYHFLSVLTVCTCIPNLLTNFSFLTFVILDVYQWQLHLHWSAWLPMPWVADDMTLNFNNQHRRGRHNLTEIALKVAEFLVDLFAVVWNTVGQITEVPNGSWKYQVT